MLTTVNEFKQGDHSVLGFRIQGFQGESRRFLPIFQGEFVIYRQNQKKNQGVFKEISDLLTTFTSKDQSKSYLQVIKFEKKTLFEQKKKNLS